MADPHWIGVGRIRGSHGVQGALKIEPYASAPDSVLRHVRRWRLADDISLRPGPRPLVLPQIVRRGRCRVQADMLVAEVILLDGQPPLSREQAMALKGVEIQVDRADFPAPGDDEFYHSDLVGCEVIGQNEQHLGQVVAVDDHGAQQVLRLADGMLIPFVQAIVQSVDIGQKCIRVDWAADWR